MNFLNFQLIKIYYLPRMATYLATPLFLIGYLDSERSAPVSMQLVDSDPEFQSTKACMLYFILECSPWHRSEA